VKYDDYIKNIVSGNFEDEDLELGLLSELKEEAPKELHERVMQRIREENKPAKYFEYRRYLPAVAAAAIFIAAIGFSKNLINKDTNNSNSAQVENLPRIAQQTDNLPKSSDKGDFTVKSEILNQGTSEEKSINNQGKTSSNLAQSKLQNNLNNLKENKKINKNQIENNKIQKKNNAVQNQHVALNDKKASIIQGAAKDSVEQPKDNTNKTTETQSDALAIVPEAGFETLTEGQKLRERAIAKKFEYGISINYEINLSIDQIDIIDFINARGSILNYTVYKLTKEDAAILDEMLSRANINKEPLGGDSDSDYVIIKLNIKNE
jgi:hypothetical protein